jgi:hypothetical protein
VLGAPVGREASGLYCEQERDVGVIGVQEVVPAKVVPIIAGNGGEIGVELIVGFREKRSICRFALCPATPYPRPFCLLRKGRW